MQSDNIPFSWLKAIGIVEKGYAPESVHTNCSRFEAGIQASRRDHPTACCLESATSKKTPALTRNGFRASRCLLGQKFLDYAILGDDLVIADPNVASEYLKIMDECEVTISKEKSLISSVGACEFAKRFMTEKVTVDFSPISFKVMNMFGGFVPHYQLDGLHYRTSVRLRGGGSRVYSTGDKPVHAVGLDTGFLCIQKKVEYLSLSIYGSLSLREGHEIHTVWE